MNNPEPQPPQLPRLAKETTRERPWPLAKLSENIKIYVEKMSPLWVEAQIVQLSDRGATKMSFLTLRDVDADMSMEVSAFGNVISASGAPIAPGSRVVAHVKPTYWLKTGRLVLQAKEIYPVGLGDLLARIEKLRQQLQAEGLFEDAHKKPLPFLPRKIGLICGNNAKAKDDVLVNATARWPGAQFEVREVLVQGTGAVPGVCGALAELDQLADVDVIVIARGGGSVEDLLPFSEEVLVRAVFAARTPVVSAIGHEGDSPLIDLVADYRASTPTDAARRIVPDLAAEMQGLTSALQELRHRFQTRLTAEAQHLKLLLDRPVLTTPAASLQSHFESLETAKAKLTHAVSLRLTQAQAELNAAVSTLKAISPQATLERGYAIIKAPGKGVLTDATQVKKGEILEARLAKGSMIVTVFGTNKVESSDSE
ncbi:MAG: exodeoxyribonuclease VII large subunit [Actinomycetaceae bacterium]|nr:exodeoxyribonuclease VII large subunit [Actinomycetaceae bacterium]